MKKLPKFVLNKMSDMERKKLDKMDQAHAKLVDDMCAAQEKYSIASRKPNYDIKKLNHLANEGFRLEYLAAKSLDALEAHEKSLRNKYK